MKNNAFPLLNRERKERKSAFFSFMKSITLVHVVGMMLILVVGMLLGCPAGTSGSAGNESDNSGGAGNVGGTELGTGDDGTGDDVENGGGTELGTGGDGSGDSGGGENGLGTGSGGNPIDSDNDGVPDIEDVDDDNDGLIEVHSLTMLHNMRYNLAGTSYNTASDGTADTTGAPTASTKASDHACSGNALLCGYELTQSLTFDKDGDGTFTESIGTVTLDSDDNAAPYFVVANGGWEPIGVFNPAKSNLNKPFTAIFEGNGYTISHLAIQRDAQYMGMFGAIDSGAIIRNIGLIENFAEYSGNNSSAIHIGGLVGSQKNATIINSYTERGHVNAKSSAHNSAIGGLVGAQQDGFVIASHTSVDVNGGTNHTKTVGGLVGKKSNGTIIASHATGDVDGSLGDSDNAGGLVGYHSAGAIIASYASGNVDGGDGNADVVGGLIGQQATGGSFVASYAAGPVNGGAGNNDFVGKLVGLFQGTSTLSYGFGSKSGGETATGLEYDGELPAGVTAAIEITAANAGDAWNNLNHNTASAWSFVNSKPPALNYADYDGTHDTYSCDLFPAGKCGTLLPGQHLPLPLF